jgi:dipeptidyl aminopeptidase/acylaminoacyl peptidase
MKSSAKAVEPLGRAQWRDILKRFAFTPFSYPRWAMQILNYSLSGKLHFRMLRILILGVSMLSTAVPIRNANAAGKPTLWTPELMLSLKRVGSVQVSPSGKRVAFTVRVAVTEHDKSEYLTHIYLSDSANAPGRQLTQGEKSCDDPQWSPDGEWIAFVSARTGKKNLWLIRATGGEASQISDSKTDISSFKWSPDGKSIAFTAADAPTDDDDAHIKSKNDARVVDENFKRNRLFLIPVSIAAANPSPARQLTSGEQQHVSSENRPGRPAFDWSPDGKTIAISHTRTPAQDDWTSSDISLVDVETGAVRILVKSAAVENSPLFSPDGQSIAYLLSDTPPTWGGTRTVQVIAATGGTSRALAETKDGFGRYSELVGWSKDQKQIYFTEIQGTSMRMMGLPVDGSPAVVLGGADGISLGGVFLNSSRTHFGFGWEQSDEPSEAYACSVTELGDPQRVSGLHDDFPDIALSTTEVIRWKSSDGMEIEGLLTYPAGYNKSQKYPLLLIIHGGPMGAFTQTFDGTAGSYPVAAFASKGFAILRANVRGSSGYGKKFRYANYNDWGGGDFQDLMTGVDHVINLGVADKDRLGVMGWSYGGYLTSWTITQTKRFKAASVGAGVTNLMSFTGTADIPGFLPDYFAGEFWDKLDTYRKHSPMFQIKGVTTPTLIQHGEKDERVPLSQGQELYNALKRPDSTELQV